ncbi:DUF3426 domain-containing protein [Arenimonas donghaensis]|uniref:DUF3426 domain-containing protein n=1 Tax=Arenimonas donghaensis DSM 18148 = HO3-R19 TaxID=1121014 RepID=A0A087MKA9_9GAMM|nr:DUF3426 domain-containing protein [Arenimonas donghaensis]KFL37312.1 hypothetical protein N788_09950 [Arenimonas donghaensis DSM 18148 = HO3-R19]
MPPRPPRFAVPDAPAPRTPRPWGWWGLALVLVVALALQLMLADRARLATDPDWRPRLEFLCDTLGCDLPAWREPAAFRVTSREVRRHPQDNRALLITTSFRNDARWGQPWPVMELALHDIDGNALGLRRFEPHEYLGSPPATELIAPNQSASATLEILDPGQRAVAFTFDFH